MTITSLEPNKVVSEELKFLKPMEAVADIKFAIEPATGGVKVDWVMSGENKSTLDKWMGLCMGMMMKTDFDNGLKDLSEKYQESRLKKKSARLGTWALSY